MLEFAIGCVVGGLIGMILGFVVLAVAVSSVAADRMYDKEE